jgi:DNA excision repair protein ERCC-4
MIPLCLDDREARGPLLAALRTLDAFDIRIKRLKLGDVLVDGALTFERKTVVDLAVSIADGRLFDQALRLAACKRPAALLVEGRAADISRTDMRIEAFQGALVNIALLVGVPLLRSRTPEESARLILYAARQHRRRAEGALPRRGRRPTGKAALQNHVLQGLPGVGPERARRLLARFGSVAAVMTAARNELADVAGIGPGVAGKIRWAVEEPRATFGWAEQAVLPAEAGTQCLEHNSPEFPHMQEHGSSAQLRSAPERQCSIRPPVAPHPGVP